MKQTRRSSTLLLTILVLFIVLFVFFLYTFLHEAGHALAGSVLGQSLTEFNVNFWDLSAHVGLVGGKLTESQLAVQAVAGSSLPLLIWGLFIGLVPRKASFSLEVLKLLSSMGVVNTLLAWIVLPLLFLSGSAPSDDVTNFLRHSQMPPLLLTLLALILYIGGWILFLSKIDGLRNQFLLFTTNDRERLVTGLRTNLSAMTAIMAGCLVLVFVLQGAAEKNSLNKFSPPQGFDQVARLELSRQEYPSEVLTQFTLDRPTYVGVFIAVRNIDTTYFDLSITGPNQFHSTVLHGEGYNAAQDGGLWEQSLPAGTYQLVLTAHQSPGIASVYLKTHEGDAK